MKERLTEAVPAALGWLGMLWISPAAALAVLALGAGLLAAARSLTLSLCLAALSFPLGAWLIDHPGLPRLALAVALGAGIGWYYRDGLELEA